jgi:hypothetical protein
MPRLAFAIALALLVGCQKPPADSDSASMPSTTVRLVLDRATYGPGDDVKLTITNDTPRELGYNACTRVVERESGAGWIEVPEPDRVCTMELRPLARAETVTEQTDVPPLPAGRYRIALTFSDESASPGEPVRAVSEPFTVR